MRKTLLLVIITAAIFAGCKKDDKKQPENFYAKAQGNWVISKISYSYTDTENNPVYNTEYTPNSPVNFTGEQTVIITDTANVSTTYTYQAPRVYDSDMKMNYYNLLISGFKDAYFSGKNGTDGPYRVLFPDDNTMLGTITITSPTYYIPGSTEIRTAGWGYFVLTFKRR